VTALIWDDRGVFSAGWRGRWGAQIYGETVNLTAGTLSVTTLILQFFLLLLFTRRSRPPRVTGAPAATF
jgi:hypothetical protein